MSDVLKIKKNTKSLRAVVQNIGSDNSDTAEDEALRIQRDREKYFENGFSEGYAKAKSELEKEYTDQLLDKSEEFYSILSSFEKKLFEYESSFNRIIVDVAKKLSEKIVRREIEISSSIEEVLRDSSKKVLGANEVIIKINPEDYSFLTIEGKNEQFEQAFSRIKFEQTKSVDKGGCIIETEIGNVDGRISSQINEVVKQVEQKLFEE